MPQEHLDRLSAVDASFLLQEGANTHMQIGCVATFNGPPPSYEDLLEHVGSRLHLVPRYRQKVRTPPLRTGRPLWVDDPNFNLAYHVRQTGLPRPGSEDQLLALAGRIFSQRLDRTKPLWEMWLVEGYERALAGAAGGRGRARSRRPRYRARQSHGRRPDPSAADAGGDRRHARGHRRG